jgi:nucleotide-binding universal stress UspA family protein
MFNQPTVLVCTDFSSFSDNAVRAGADLARKSRGQVHLVHVAQASYYKDWHHYVSAPEEVKNQFLELIHQDLLQRMSDQLKRCGVEANMLIRFDSNTYSGIEKASHELKASVIVVGSRGADAPALERVLIGSLTKKLFLHSEIPLLVIKNDRPLDSFAALVSSEEDLKPVLNVAQELSYLHSSLLSVVSVYPKNPGLYFGNALDFSSSLISEIDVQREDYLKMMKTKIQESLANVKAQVTLTSAFNVPQSIIEILEGNNLSTAVLKRTHKNRLDRFLQRSVSTALLEEFKGNFFFC